MNLRAAAHARSFPSITRRTAAVLLSLSLLAASGLWAQPASAQIVPGGSTVEGKTIGNWGFEWWQWVFGITSPDPMIDTTGAAQSAGQAPPVWYTCGAAGPATGNAVTRNFSVPADQHILVSLFSVGVYFEDTDPANLCTEIVPDFVSQTTALSFSLDGVPISQANLFTNHRETSSLDLTTVVVPGNPYAPPGIYPGSCSDGYFVMIEPLPHVITVLPPAAPVPLLSPAALVLIILVFMGVGTWLLFRRQAAGV
jgi:hypothetical protein